MKRLIYLGGLGTNSENLSPHLESRKEVGQILRSSRIPCVEIQASIIIGSGSLSYEIMKNLVERLPVMVTPKWVSSLAQPIWINDVISYLIESIELKSMNSCVIQIGGPADFVWLDASSWSEALATSPGRKVMAQGKWVDENMFVMDKSKVQFDL